MFVVSFWHWAHLLMATNTPLHHLTSGEETGRNVLLRLKRHFKLAFTL
jgi:hypothetical protein